MQYTFLYQDYSYMKKKYEYGYENWAIKKTNNLKQSIHDKLKGVNFLKHYLCVKCVKLIYL